MESKLIKVVVMYANTDNQFYIEVSLPTESTVLDAIFAADLLDKCPEIDFSQQKVGIFSKICSLKQRVLDGDRIEIYRPLLIDPKEARRARSLSQSKK